MKKNLFLILIVLTTSCSSLVQPTNPGNPNTGYVPASWLTNAVGIANAVNQAAPQGPWTAVVTSALGAISLLVGGYAARKSRQVAAAHEVLAQKVNDSK